MEKRARIRLILFPLLSAFVLFSILELMIKVSHFYHFPAISELFFFFPNLFFIITGSLLLLIFIPIFFAGIYALGPLGLIGDSDVLQREGAFRYVRNPIYSGGSFALLGLSLVADSTPLFATTIVFLILTIILSIREEKELVKKFETTYHFYRTGTPMFLPDFELMIKDLIRRRREEKEIDDNHHKSI